MLRRTYGNRNLVLSHNHNDSDVNKRNKVVDKGREVCVRTIKEYRTHAAMCRAQSISDPRNRDIWLAEERAWLRKVDEEIASHFKERNTTSSSDLAQSQAPANANDTRWKTIDAA